MEKRRRGDLSGHLVGIEKANRVLSHAHGVTPVRSGHAVPEGLLTGDQVVQSPGFVGRRGPEGKEGTEKALGQMEPRAKSVAGTHLVHGIAVACVNSAPRCDGWLPFMLLSG